MPSPCSTGETLDPPLLTVVPNKALNHFWHVRSRTIFAWNMVLFSSPPVQGRNPTAFSDWGTCDMSAGWSFLLLLVLLLLHDLFLLLCFLSSFFCNWYTDNDARSSTRSTCKHTAPKAGDCLIHILLPAGGAPCQQHCPTSPWPPSLSFCADGHLPASHAAAAFLLPPPASSVLPPAGAHVLSFSPPSAGRPCCFFFSSSSSRYLLLYKAMVTKWRTLAQAPVKAKWTRSERKITCTYKKRNLVLLRLVSLRSAFSLLSFIQLLLIVNVLRLLRRA